MLDERPVDMLSSIERIDAIGIELLVKHGYIMNTWSQGKLEAIPFTINSTETYPRLADYWKSRLK